MAFRRQWIQDTQAHVNQIQSSLHNVFQSFTAVAVPGNVELHSEVASSNQQQQLALAHQDAALDRIEEAAARVGRLGLAIGDELRVRMLFYHAFGVAGPPLPPSCLLCGGPERVCISAVQQDDQWRALEGSCACAAAAGIKQPLLRRWGMLVQEQEGLLGSVERDTEGVMSRVSASMYKLQDVLKKMKFCTQLIIIVVLFVILIGMLFYTFGRWRFLDTVVNAKVRECPVRSGLILTIGKSPSGPADGYNDESCRK
jgi:hypothetical protein